MSETSTSIDRAAKALERISLVLAAMYAGGLEGATLGDKAERLSAMGFTNAQIANALGSSENSVNVSRVQHRKTSKRPGRRPGKKQRRT